MASKKTIKKTKIIGLLKTFSPLEWKRFGRFIQSPYHNSNQTIIKFYTVLKKFFPFESEDGLGQELLFKKVFGKEEFKSSKLQNLCSDLYGLAEDFLIDVYLQKEKRQRKKVLIDALSERNYELFKGESQKLVQEVETQKWFLDNNDFLLLYQLNDQYHHHIETDKFTINQIELEKTWVYLEAFHEDAIVQIKAENATAKNFLKRKKDLENNNENQLKRLFQEAMEIHKSKQTDGYFQLKEKVFMHWKKLKTKHKTNLLVHLLNFIITNELLQKSFAFEEALGLYKIGIKEKLFIVNNKMRDIEFFNICMMSIKLESEEWTNNFIETHQQYLKKEIREFLVPLSYAYNALFQKDHEKVIYLLSKVNPSNNLNYLRKVKKLLVRAYVDGIIDGEENYKSPFYYEIDAFKKMMNRNGKLSDIKIEATINFINLTKKLVDLILNKPYNIRQILDFETLILNTKPLILEKWLHEKYFEIKSAAS